MDERLAALDSHPHIEVRLFNPFTQRDWRWVGYLTDFGRLNRRMHNKSITADDRVSIVGGRNMGDEYFGAGQERVQRWQHLPKQAPFKMHRSMILSLVKRRSMPKIGSWRWAALTRSWPKTPRTRTPATTWAIPTVGWVAMTWPLPHMTGRWH